MSKIKKFIDNNAVDSIYLFEAMQEISDRLDAHDRQLKEQGDWIKALEKVMASYEKRKYPVAQDERGCESCLHEEDCMDNGKRCRSGDKKLGAWEPKAQEQLSIKYCSIPNNVDCHAYSGGRCMSSVCPNQTQQQAQEQLWICEKWLSCEHIHKCGVARPHKYDSCCEQEGDNPCGTKCIPYAQEQGGDDKDYDALLKKYQDLMAWYDKHSGTPCEQIRHEHEVADLRARLASAEETVCKLIAEKAGVEVERDEAIRQLKEIRADRDRPVGEREWCMGCSLPAENAELKRDNERLKNLCAELVGPDMKQDI